MRKDYILDVVAGVGAAAVLWGLAMIYVPLAPIVGGLTVIAGCARVVQHRRHWK